MTKRMTTFQDPTTGKMMGRVSEIPKNQIISTKQKNKKPKTLLVTVRVLCGNLKRLFITDVKEIEEKTKSKTVHGRYSLGDYMDSF